MPKILEIDRLLREDSARRDVVREVHPELCFAILNGGWDAFVALWTAERIARGRAISIPTCPPLDEYGLRMEMLA